MLDINFVEEIAWLKYDFFLLLVIIIFDVWKLFLLYRKWVNHVNSPINFSHNDLQGGNILLRNDLGDSGMFRMFSCI